MQLSVVLPPAVFKPARAPVTTRNAEIDGSVDAPKSSGGIVHRNSSEEGKDGHEPETQRLAANLAACDALVEVPDERQTRQPVPNMEEEHRTRMTVKESLRRQMTKPEYDASAHYHKRGIYQWIVQHPRFEKMTFFVIVMNTIWIAVDTDYNKASTLLDSAPIFQVAEHTFCIYFAFEWTMRFLAFKRKRYALRDGWFVFDSVLVGCMVVDSWLMSAIVLAGGASGGSPAKASVLRLARLLRLSRTARMLRLLRAMPELFILIKGLIAAMRAVIFTLGLLIVVIYLFAIAFKQLCDGTVCGEVFTSVPMSMNLLFLKALLINNLSDLTDPLAQQSYALLGILYLYLFLAYLTMINMLTGVIVDVVSRVAASEKELLTVSYVKESIQQLVLQGADADGDNLISKKEFMNLLNNQKATAILQNIGVDVVGLVDFADTIFTTTDEHHEEQERSLSFEEFMEVLLDLRGSNNAKVRDIVELRKFLNGRIVSLQHRIRKAMQRTARSSSPLELGVDNILGKQHGTALELEVGSKLQHLINQSLKEIVDVHQHEVSALRAENCKLRTELFQISDCTPFGSTSRESLTRSEGFAAASSEMPIMGEWTPLPPEGLHRRHARRQSDAMPLTRGESLLEGSVVEDQQLMQGESALLAGEPRRQALGSGHEHEPGGQAGCESQEARDSATAPPHAFPKESADHKSINSKHTLTWHF